MKSFPCTCMSVGRLLASYSFILVMQAFNSTTICFAQNFRMCSLMLEKRFMIYSLANFAGHYIYFDHNDDPKYTRICSRHMDASMKRYLVKMAMMALGYNIALSGEVFACLFTGVWTTTIEAKIPFTEEKSNEEFLVNLILQSIVTVHGGLSYVANGSIHECRHGRPKAGPLQAWEADWGVQNEAHLGRPADRSIPTQVQGMCRWRTLLAQFLSAWLLSLFDCHVHLLPVHSKQIYTLQYILFRVYLW